MRGEDGGVENSNLLDSHIKITENKTIGHPHPHPTPLANKITPLDTLQTGVRIKMSDMVIFWSFRNLDSFGK